MSMWALKNIAKCVKSCGNLCSHPGKMFEFFVSSSLFSSQNRQMVVVNTSKHSNYISFCSHDDV